MLQLKNSNLTFKAFIFWMLIWLAALIGIVNPDLTSRFAKIFGIGRGADIVIYLSIALIFYLIFRLSIFIEDIRHEITRLTREIALLEIKKTKRIRRK